MLVASVAADVFVPEYANNPNRNSAVFHSFSYMTAYTHSTPTALQPSCHILLLIRFIGE